MKHVRGQPFANYYNNERYNESLNNLTPVDVYQGRTNMILDKLEKIKNETLAKRKAFNMKQGYARYTQ